MKKLIAILSLLLSFCLLSGCSEAFVKKQVEKTNMRIHETKNTKIKEKTELEQKEIINEQSYNEVKTNVTESLLDNEEKEYADNNVVIEEIVINEDVQNENIAYELDEDELKPEISEDVCSSDEVKDVIEEAFNFTKKTLLASGKTTFNPEQTNRSSNLRLAANYINGVILMPGEEFSFNTVVGRRTADRGFLLADVFSGNSVVKGIGGGICQTSTTLCIAVKQTEMKILEQNPHSMRVTYASYEDEAMINYGTSDFRFRNTYEFPVVIEIHFEQSEEREIIICDIYSLE